MLDRSAVCHVTPDPLQSDYDAMATHDTRTQSAHPRAADFVLLRDNSQTACPHQPDIAAMCRLMQLREKAMFQACKQTFDR